jgi:hypothetical protein
MPNNSAIANSASVRQRAGSARSDEEWLCKPEDCSAKQIEQGAILQCGDLSPLLKSADKSARSKTGIRQQKEQPD